jgi:hypothetical protein
MTLHGPMFFEMDGSITIRAGIQDIGMAKPHLCQIVAEILGVFEDVKIYCRYCVNPIGWEETATRQLYMSEMPFMASQS